MNTTPAASAAQTPRATDGGAASPARPLELCAGHPRFQDAALAALARDQGAAAAWKAAFARYGTAAAQHVHGDFAVAVNLPDQRTFIAVDRFAVRTLCYAVEGDALRVGLRADELTQDRHDLDPQALFDYLHFHMIPAPRTVFRGVQRLPAGHCAVHAKGKLAVERWWRPRFDEHERAPVARLAEEFRALVREAVNDAQRGRVGCFLSGGTDSSTVAGMQRMVSGEAPETFSIGFDADGYDEMEFARIAARHFKTKHHEYYVTPADLVRSIPQIAAALDQPFGNSSVIPAYCCAKMARDAGIDTMLAGDGGDELFGGNTRYARQKVFAAYERVPASLRRGLLEGFLLRSTGFKNIALLRKAQSYVEQARVPMPDRLQAYNLLNRMGIPEVFTDEFIAGVDPGLPPRLQRTEYEESAGSALVNRMLALDWKYTLADNDLPKVLWATSLAGVDAAFPLLDDRLVDFSLRLRPSLKVKGLTLRWFFKEALRGFLPDAIIAKSKHGFGLPFGVWLLRDEPLMALARDSLALLRDAGVVRPAFLDRLAGEYLPRHPGYYGEMIWILMMLAQWRAARPAESHSPPRAAGAE